MDGTRFLLQTHLDKCHLPFCICLTVIPQISYGSVQIPIMTKNFQLGKHSIKVSFPTYRLKYKSFPFQPKTTFPSLRIKSDQSHECKPANISLNNQNFTEKKIQISLWTLYNMAISSVEVYLHLSKCICICICIWARPWVQSSEL